MTAIQPFHFSGQQVRVVTDEHGEPWFVAADVAAVLDLGNPRSSLALLDEDEKGVHSVDTPGGTQQVTVINEPGLYSLVLRSRKPEAKAFKRWVTHEVLPAIRRTGAYAATSPAEISRADLARMVLAAEEELSVVTAALKSAEPAIAYVDRYVANDDAAIVKVWGAQFGLTERQAYDLLLERKLVYRQSIGQRWSAKAQKVVTEYEYRARAGRPSFPWFDLRPQHNAPRHHNGQVRQTLYIRQAHALDLAQVAGITSVTALGGAA